MKFKFNTLNLQDFDAYAVLIGNASNIAKEEFLSLVEADHYNQILKQIGNVRTNEISYWASIDTNGDKVVYFAFDEVEYVFGK